MYLLLFYMGLLMLVSISIVCEETQCARMVKEEREKTEKELGLAQHEAVEHDE